jgi:D-glycero-alpha-D-manno-heptose-7-phosphate kinase
MLIVQTPLRISLLGGGTDFEDFYLNHGGAVLTTAIDKCIFVVVKERFDHLICLNYSQREKVEKVDQIHHELIRETMRMTGANGGIEITTLADVPSEGTGLGSSSSITVGLLQALYAYRGETVPAKTLAKEACRIEIDILGKPIGRQDQYIAAYGNLRFITFNNTGVTVEKVELSPEDKKRLNDSLLLFYTGVTRKSSEILAEQKTNINNCIDSLNDIKQLAYRARDAIMEGDFDDFGEILHQGWELKKKLNDKISNHRFDEIYAAARKAGAIGGKVTGAGGGGFILFYCPKGKQDEVRRTLKLRELPFHFEQDGSKVIFNYRRSS